MRCQPRNARRSLDDGATYAAARFAGRIGFEVVSVGVHNQSAAADAVGSLADRDAVNHQYKRGLAVFIRSQVAENGGWTGGSGGRTVLVCLGVEVPPRAHSIGCAAIAFLVDT